MTYKNHDCEKCRKKNKEDGEKSYWFQEGERGSCQREDCTNSS